MKIVTIIILLMTGCATVQAQSLAFKSRADVSMWMQTYYLDPSPERIVPAIRTFAADRESMDNLLRMDSVIHFFDVLLADNKELLPRVKQLLSESQGNAQRFIAEIVMQAENPQSLTANDPNDLDKLWAEFYASGDDESVWKILDVLTLREDALDLTSKFWVIAKIQEPQKALNLLQGSALWSLNSNKEKHPTVKIVLKKALSKDDYSARVKSLVNKMLG